LTLCLTTRKENIMGTKGTEIVGLNVKELIADLNRAYADEWLAFYAYTHMAQVVSGRPAAKAVQETLEHIAGEELEHQGELAERIVSLGGKPVASPGQLEASANEPYPTPPGDETDLEAIIQTVLKAEAGAIEVYRKLADKTHGKDHITYQLAVHILGEEVEHEDEFEQLTK